MFIKKFVFIALFFFCNSILPQTSSYGNYDVYSHETTMNSFGFINSMFLLPPSGGYLKINMKGIMFEHDYELGEIGKVVFSSDFRGRIVSEGAFRIGLGVQSPTHSSGYLINYNASESLKYYFATLDLFSYGVGMEFTYASSDGYGVTFKCVIDIFNIGGSAAILEKGVFKQHAFGTLDLVPLNIRPSIFFDFGKSGIGISAFINSFNLFEYTVWPEELFSDDYRGLKFSNASIRRFAFQILFVL